MALGHARLQALAIVAVGLAVATADRADNVRTEPRHRRAGPSNVGEEALPGRSLTEQATVTVVRRDDKAVAGLADPDRIGPAGNCNQQRQCRHE